MARSSSVNVDSQPGAPSFAAFAKGGIGLIVDLLGTARLQGSRFFDALFSLLAL